MISVVGPEGKLLLDPNPDFTHGIEPSPQLKATILEFNGVFRFAARKMIAARLEADGLMEKIELHSHVVPHGDRSNAVIEPRLTDQWYVDVKTLAGPAIDAVKRGRTVFVPKNWESPIFTGWRTSSRGASRASFGGAIRSRPGTGLGTETPSRFLSRKPMKRPAPTRLNSIGQRRWKMENPMPQIFNG